MNLPRKNSGSDLTSGSRNSERRKCLAMRMMSSHCFLNSSEWGISQSSTGTVCHPATHTTAVPTTALKEHRPRQPHRQTSRCLSSNSTGRALRVTSTQMTTKTFAGSTLSSATRSENRRYRAIKSFHSISRISIAQIRSHIQALPTCSTTPAQARRCRCCRCVNMSVSTTHLRSLPRCQTTSKRPIDLLLAPGDLPADHAGLFLVAGIVGAVQREVPKRHELRLYAV